MSFLFKKAPPVPGFIREPNAPWHVRRGLGFTLKARIGAPEDVQVRVKRHGGERNTALSRAELRFLMERDRFRPLEDAALCERLEARDLLYYARGPAERATSGRPIGLQQADRVCLRDGVGLTLAIEDDDGIVPWVFMPRRGALENRRLRGVRFSSFEAGNEAYALDLFGDDKEVLALRDVLPCLDGRATFSELVRAHSDAAVSILGWLDDAGFLTRDLPERVVEPEAYVNWLGHACVLLRVGSERVMVDPLCMRRSDPPKAFVQAPFDFRTLPPADVICLTHGDNDHLNPATLVRFPRDTPLVIPAAPPKRPYQVDMAEVLRFLGFSRIHVLSPWESALFGGTRVTACPFEGEDWGLQLQKATFLVSGARGTVYLGADSVASEPSLDRARALGPIDFAFLGVSGCEEPLVSPPGFGYGEFYALWLSRDRRNEWVRHTDGPREAAAAAERLEARRVFGYAAGGGSFMEMAHADRGTHAELRALSPRAVELALGEPFSLP